MLTKIALLLGALALSYEFIEFRLQSLESFATFAVFVALAMFYTVILLSTAFVRSFGVRLFWAAVLVPAFFFYESSQRVFGEPMSYSAFITLVSARGFLSDSLNLYGAQMIVPLLQSAMLTAGLLLPAGRLSFQRSSWVISSLPLLGVLVMITLLYARGGYGASGLPSMFTTLSYGTLYLYEEFSEKSVPRKSVTLRKGSQAVPENIVLIMDESVRGDYLDINSLSGVNSGLAREKPGVDIYNFGLAASASNCSDATNLIARYGSNREAIDINIKTKPSIWQYAKAAGYRTVYIDAQRTGGEMHNRMRALEFDWIEMFVQFDGVPVVDRDMATIDSLDDLLEDSERDFIYINKVGAHFPVHDKYPDDFMLYEPALPRGSLGEISDTGERAGLFSGDWESYVNSYRNTLSWSVGEYFERFFERLDLSDTVVVYTADHGQNFHERGEPGYNTHCSISPVQEEGIVPLVIMAGEEVEALDLAGSAKTHFDRASLFGLFPTLIETMGFDSAEVSAVYEPSWFDEETLPFSFNYNFNARLGEEHKFMTIDLDTLNAR